MPRTNDLTIKQRKFLQEYIRNGGNGMQAALKAYNAKKPFTAASIANENLNKPYIKDKFHELLEKNGLSDDLLIKEHKKIITQNGKLHAKLAAIKMGYDLKGKFKHQSSSTLINDNLPEDSCTERITLIMERINQLQAH